MDNEKPAVNNRAEIKLGPKKLTIKQIEVLESEQRNQYLRSMTAREKGQYLSQLFLSNLNNSKERTI